MRNGTGTGLVLLAGLACGMPGGAAMAKQAAIASLRVVTDDGANADRYRVPDFDRTRRAARKTTLDWGTGSFSLQGQRLREGSKHEGSSAASHDWHRSIAAGVSGWQALTPDVAIGAGARIMRTTSGLVGGPLLSRRSVAVSREAFVALRGGGGGALALSLFDNGGWKEVNAADVVNRMINGEARARKGAALAVGLVSGPVADDDMKLSLRLERASAPGLPAETSGMLAFKLRF